MLELFRSASITAALGITLLFAAQTTIAATLNVTNTDDSGTGSLRQAVLDANASPDNDTINFVFSGCPCTILLTSGELVVANNGSLTINGNGVDFRTVSGNSSGRVFNVSPGANVTIQNVTIAAGAADFGGAIINWGTLTLNNARVHGSAATIHGGGIANVGGNLTTNNTIFSANTAAQVGGGVYNQSGIMTLENSTVNGNSAQILGGGVMTFVAGTTILNNTTVSGNSAQQVGGGIVNSMDSNTTLNNTTVSNNSAQNGVGGIATEGAVTLNNSIIANSPGGDCLNSGGTVNSTYSLVEDGSCGVVDGAGGNLTGEPLLGPLQNNGGATFTHALLQGSPAIDAGNSTLTIDQRGLGRPVDFLSVPNAAGGNASDIGAFEVQPGGIELNYTVDTISDDASLSACTAAADDCSLRGAIINASSSPESDSIDFDATVFAAPQTIVLGGTQLTIANNGPLTIDGPGADRLTVSAGGNSRVISISPRSNATINGLIITGGSGENFGGGILSLGTVTLNNVTVRGNSAILNGGGVSGGGILTINNSTIDGNSATVGGGIYNAFQRDLTLNGSTVSNNTANRGGGIDSDGTLTLNNSTVSNNVAPVSAAGINVLSGYRLYLNHSTVTNNTGRGINASGLSSVSNSIVANNVSGTDCNGLTSINVSFSLVGDGSCGVVNGINGNLIGDAMLGPLADNGGPTFTHALLCGSPAIDRGKNVNSLATDQRGTGFARTFDDTGISNADGGDATDIGAVELQAALECNMAPVAVDDAFTVTLGLMAEFPAGSLLANDSDPEGAALTAILITGPTNSTGFVLNADGSFTYVPTAFLTSDSFTYKVSDGVKESAPATVTIDINYQWSGFLAPVENMPNVNSAKASQAIPLKFSLGGNQGMNILLGIPGSQQVGCDGTGPSSEVDPTNSPGSNVLSYDSVTGQYQYIWKTERSWKNTCRILILKLADGTEHSAIFSFK